MGTKRDRMFGCPILVYSSCLYGYKLDVTWGCSWYKTSSSRSCIQTDGLQYVCSCEL